MIPSHTHSRINLTELKSQMVKKLGPERSKQYFYYLNRFLSLKMNKVEFNKLCFRILGRENIPLHNHMIRSLLRNACTAKTPPPPHKDEVSKQGTKVISNEITSNCNDSNGAHVLSNGGDILPVSPKKARSNFHPRSGARVRALGLNGKTSLATQLFKDTQSSDFNVVLENGDLNQPKLPVIRTPNDPNLVSSKEKTVSVVKNDGKEDFERSPLRAPLGVPLCPVSIGGGPRVSPLTSSSVCVGMSNEGALLDSLTLKERIDQIALAQGLEGVSLDCANLLNNGLDSYMKMLISSCIELVGTRSNNLHKHQIYTKSVNGVMPDHQNQVSISGTRLEEQECKIQREVSLQDFRVAMEMNPRQLGEDWPLLLEKISTRGN